MTVVYSIAAVSFEHIDESRTAESFCRSGNVETLHALTFDSDRIDRDGGLAGFFRSPNDQFASDRGIGVIASMAFDAVLQTVR